MKNKFILGVLLSLSLCICKGKTADNNIYYASLEGDTLRIGNSLIERTFIWNNGNLKTYALIDKANNQRWITESRDVDFVVPQLRQQTSDGVFSKRIVPANGVMPLLRMNLPKLSWQNMYGGYVWKEDLQAKAILE